MIATSALCDGDKIGFPKAGARHALSGEAKSGRIPTPAPQTAPVEARPQGDAARSCSNLVVASLVMISFRFAEGVDRPLGRGTVTTV
jgi:hypothetical protein